MLSGNAVPVAPIRSAATDLPPRNTGMPVRFSTEAAADEGAPTLRKEVPDVDCKFDGLIAVDLTEDWGIPGDAEGDDVELERETRLSEVLPSSLSEDLTLSVPDNETLPRPDFDDADDNLALAAIGDPAAPSLRDKGVLVEEVGGLIFEGGLLMFGTESRIQIIFS